MAEAPLTKHPETGEPVRRVFGEPNAPRAWTDSRARASSRQEPRGEGVHQVRQDAATARYEKTTAKGPKKIHQEADPANRCSLNLPRLPLRGD